MLGFACCAPIGAPLASPRPVLFTTPKPGPLQSQISSKSEAKRVERR